MDPLNDLEAGLSLVSARVFGWPISIELAKAPRDTVACEGWKGRGL